MSLGSVPGIRHSIEQLQLDNPAKVYTEEEVQMDEEICYGMVGRGLSTYSLRWSSKITLTQ